MGVIGLFTKVANMVAAAETAAASKAKMRTGVAIADAASGVVQVQIGAQIWDVTDYSGRVRTGDQVTVLEQENHGVVVVNAREAGSPLIPVGGVIMWPGSSAPAGGAWAICNGATYSSATYPELYAVLGSTSLPDLRNRFPRGADSAAVKSTGGSEYISENQLPAHDHSIDNSATDIAAPGSSIGSELLGHSSSGGWYTGTAGGGQAYWPKYYAFHYLIRMR